MSNKEILTKAIQKALDNKWVGEWNDPGVSNPKAVLDWYEVESLSTNFDNYKLFIFNHDFAKAVFGDGPYYRFDGDTLDTPRQWQYHLQQMVIADDPIKYLGEHLNGKD